MLEADIEQSEDAVRKMRRWAQKCVGDAMAWLHTVIASVVRDTWVHSRQVTMSTASSTDLLNLADQCSALDADPSTAALAEELRAAHSAGMLSPAVSLKLLRYLRPNKPTPKRQMVIDGAVATASDTNAAWLARLRAQSCEDDSSHPDLARQKDLRTQYASRSQHEIGKGVWDAPVVQLEVSLLLASWDRSLAVTPDFLPREAYLSEDVTWQESVWRLIRLCGPNLLACRPSLWRQACMDTTHKNGPGSCITSFRLLTVRAQMGLLQEGVLASRLRPNINGHLCPGQSGYIRDVEDPMLALHELVAVLTHSGRMLWACLGDFKQAFPRTDRSDLLVLMYNGPLIRQGAFALLDDILEYDLLRVWLSGASSTVLRNGLPEGGSLGSLMYTTLPDDLLRSLLGAGFGVGVNISVPCCWHGHVWVCSGTHIDALVDLLVTALRSNSRLPSEALLSAWPALEASAARALDLCAPARIAMVLHADDPVIVASSAGELQRTLDAIAVWADHHRARFHASVTKSVFMSMPRSVDAPPTLVLRAHSGMPSQALHYSVVHRWLGIPWPHDLTFAAALRDAVARASSACAPLISLVAASAIPISVAMNIFELKVDSVLRFGRWLFATCHAAEACLDELLDSWARLFLGAEPWRNSFVARSELGWHLSGFARAVRCVALRRARLWSRGADDWHTSFFVRCDYLEIGWAKQSASLLARWGISDWPAVCTTCPSYRDYSLYVSSALVGVCSTSLTTALDTHSAQVPYNTFQHGPSFALMRARSLNLDWDVQLQLRGWMRMRAGLPVLRALHGRRSNARFQRCIFCSDGVRNATVHCIGRCRVWCDLRAAFVEAAGMPSLGPDRLCSAVLGVTPDDAGFVEAVRLCSEIDRGAGAYWKDAGVER